MTDDLSFPQTLDQLSNISDENYPVDKWEGAVNLVIIEDHLLFIKRSDSMPSHRGQIGFMGGHKNDGENDPIITARREFEEESSLSSELLDIIGLSLPVKTSRQKIIIPVISKFNNSMSYFFNNVKSNGEWDNCVLTPFKELQNLNSWSYAQVCNKPSYYQIYFFPLMTQFSKYLSSSSESYILWGASAKMTLNFFQNYSLNDRKP